MCILIKGNSTIVLLMGKKVDPYPHLVYKNSWSPLQRQNYTTLKKMIKSNVLKMRGSTWIG